MPGMSDSTEINQHNEREIDDDMPRLDPSPWMGETAALPELVSTSSTYMMDTNINSSTQSQYDAMPTLEPPDFSALKETAVHYTSPVSSPFMEPDQSTINPNKDIRDVSALQGSCGLHNVGNTCFMNSGLQCLLSNPSLLKYFMECFNKDEGILETMAGKFYSLVLKVWSGQYSIIHPLEFKQILAAYHPQFKDFRQHDCQEFLALLLDTLHEQLNEGKGFFKHQWQKEPCASVEEGPQPSLSTNVNEFLPGCNLGWQFEATPSTHSDCQAETSTSLTGQIKNPIGSASSQSDCTSEFYKQFEGSPGVQMVDSASSVSMKNATVVSSGSDMSEPLFGHPGMEKPSSSSEELMDLDDVMMEGYRNQEKIFTTDADSSSDVSSSQMSWIDQQGKGAEVMLAKEGGDGNSTITSIEDFYMKDTKTLNINVLAVSDNDDEEVATDSEKFHKQDNNRISVSEGGDQIEDILLFESKGASAKPCKATNLLANVKEKFSDDCNKCLFSDLETDDKCSINNIKRIKIDEDEKNLRMQARLKVNTNRNTTNEDILRESSHVIQACTSSERTNNMSHPPGGQVVGHANSMEFYEHMREKHRQEADSSWKKYLAQNQSVMVDTFQGQFKSTVVCADCNHVSVTFEPFMYLSVPLPHAMERQLSIIFIPCDTKQPIKYLLTMHKHDNIKKTKQELLKLIGEETCDLIIAEVLDNHISRILDDNTLLRYINDYSRKIYAFEMMPPPSIDDITATEEDTNTHSYDVMQKHDEILTGTPENVSSSNNTCTTNQGLDGTAWLHASEPESMKAPQEIKNNELEGCRERPVSSSVELESCHFLNNLNNQAGPSLEGKVLNIPKQEHLGTKTASQGVDSEREVLLENCDIGSLLHGPTDSDKKRPTGKEGVDNDDLTTEIGDICTDTDDVTAKDEEDVIDQWRSCAICLEDMADSDLLAHSLPTCNCTLCPSCLEMSFKYSGDCICPVCSCHVDPKEDFVPLNSMTDYKPKTRILSVPVVQRFEYQEEGKTKRKLFGHPNILYLPSQMSGEFLYESVDRVVPCLANYSILMTDGQGYHCSRCMYNQHCSGCELSRDAEISLQPGDHLAVQFTELTNEQTDWAEKFLDHKSMADLRSGEPLTLYDCFRAFTESEVLDEHNPWYCPRCKQNKCAKKTMTVWRYPDTVVVYLKRFVFHQLSSAKIDNKVIFPLENLDLSNYQSGPLTSDLKYDLQSCVCHFGGSHAGHYTAYAKHLLNAKWYYYNDETVIQQSPQDEDFSNAYILFYQRGDNVVEVNLPEKSKLDCEPDSTELKPVKDQVAKQPGSLNSDTICQLLQELRETKDVPDSTYEFYS